VVNAVTPARSTPTTSRTPGISEGNRVNTPVPRPPFSTRARNGNGTEARNTRRIACLSGIRPGRRERASKTVLKGVSQLPRHPSYHCFRSAGSRYPLLRPRRNHILATASSSHWTLTGVPSERRPAMFLLFGMKMPTRRGEARRVCGVTLSRQPSSGQIRTALGQRASHAERLYLASST
jgi:hypothetical protein